MTISAALSQTMTERLFDESSRARIFEVGPKEKSTSATKRAVGDDTADSDVRRSVDVVPQDAPPSGSTLSYAAVGLRDEYFKAIRNWEGVVDRTVDGRFFAVVRDADNAADPGDEVFEIDLEDVSEGDRELVVPGAIFYLTVGYRIRRGQRFKGTQIVFRRMPRWSKNDIVRAEERTQKLLDIVCGADQVERAG